MKSKALVTGVTGQDGSYLSELLLEKGYEVHGLLRSSSTPNTSRIDHIKSDLILHYGDVSDALCINDLISVIHPDEIYNLAAMSHVHMSFGQPLYAANVDALGPLNILESVKRVDTSIKVYQASTSELYGGMGYNMPETGYTEDSPFHPRSPYGVAKLYAYWIIRNYREAYNLFACNGILFNHESPRRTETFVTQKIITWFKKRFLSKETTDPLYIGNLDSKRDWGNAKNYVIAMWMMLQKKEPSDYVIATGVTYSVREFITLCSEFLNISIYWDENTGYLEGEEVIIQDPSFMRPSEVDVLLGDSSKAQRELGWIPECNIFNLILDMFGDAV